MSHKPNQSLRMLLSSVIELDEIEDMVRKGLNYIWMRRSLKLN